MSGIAFEEPIRTFGFRTNIERQSQKQFPELAGRPRFHASRSALSGIVSPESSSAIASLAIR